jgi:N-acetyltransferase 10
VLLQMLAYRSGYVLTYLRQTSNDLTGEHTAIMLKNLHGRDDGLESGWLSALSADFSHRLIHLFAYAFRDFDPYLALSVVENGRQVLVGGDTSEPADAAEDALATRTESASHRAAITAAELNFLMTLHDLKRLEAYSRNLVCVSPPS